MKNPDFSIGILSWNGYDSLLNSLKSYEKNGLSKLTNHKYICLPEYKTEGIEIAKSFSYEPILIKQNLGILGGFKTLAKKMPLGPILLLENDLPLIEDQSETYNQIFKSIDFLSQKKVIQVRLRSRINPGEPFEGIKKYNDLWSRNFLSTLKRKLRPNKAKKLIGTSVYALKNPNIRHPGYITKLSNGFYSVEKIVVESSNIGTAQIALKIGKNNQKEFFEKLGFFEKLNIELFEVEKHQFCFS